MQGRVRRTAGTLAAALALTAVSVAGAPPVSAGGHRARPNLQVGQVLGVPAEVEAGRSFAVRVIVLNEGRGRAAASQLSLHLSRDPRKSADDLRAGTAPVLRIAPAGRRGAAATVAVPRSAKGAYYVIACADATRRVAEVREDDNCNASRATVRVVRPVQARLVGTLDLYDSGSSDTGTWTMTWDRYAQAKVAMTVRGRGGDVRVVDAGSTYSWVGESTVTVPADPSCPSVRREDEEEVGTFQHGATSDLTGAATDPELRRLRLSASMEYAVSGSLTTCDGTVPYQDRIETVTELDLEQVAATDTKIVYRVVGSSQGSGQPSMWDSVEGTLELRLG